jgi:RNA polymerase sigma factor (sigma-70 family)
MPTSRTDSDTTSSPELMVCLDRLVAGDLAARDRIIELCGSRLRVLAGRMLAQFPNVRRWDDTDDVFQNVALRLYRTLGTVQLDAPRAIMALAATELHRELLDLARRHAGPMSFAANHETNMPGPGGDDGACVPPAVGTAQAPNESLDRWTLFHTAITNLPDDLREVFHLVWYLGVEQKAIAHVMKCSERTVRTRWQDARQAVRTALDGVSPA